MCTDRIGQGAGHSTSMAAAFTMPCWFNLAPLLPNLSTCPQAFEQVLAIHPEWRGKLVLVQVTSAAR